MCGKSRDEALHWLTVQRADKRVSIAHEIGHHIQKLTGISGKVDAMRGRISEVQQHALSVRLELQADCYAGIWANHADEAKHILEQGDIEEALNAASHIGDDALQNAGQGYVVPETFTHGSSRQRMTWFKRGLDSGDLSACNTFESKNLQSHGQTANRPGWPPGRSPRTLP